MLFCCCERVDSDAEAQGLSIEENLVGNRESHRMYWTLLLLPVCLGAALDSSKTMRNAASANNDFALELLRGLSGSNQNQFFSPLSISSAFAMTLLGANGSTAEQISKVFHFNQIDPTNPSAVHNVYADLVNTINQPNVNYSLNTANRLIADKQFKISPEYQKDVRRFYHAQLEQMDFANQPENSRLAINRWVEEETRHKIKNLFPPGSIDSLTALILVNAIYFKGTWKTEFDAGNTAKQPFHQSETKQVDVPMMSVKDSFRYAYDRELKAKMLELPYSGDHLSMLILLPDSVSGLKDLIPKLTSEKIFDLLDRAFTQQVKVKLPKFQIESELSLKDQLQSMGLVDLFSDKSDLSGMLDEDRTESMSQVRHKAFIEVDEKGTRAAAATALLIPLRMGGFHLSPTFTVDHPFLFAIVDTRTDFLVFVGTVSAP